MNHNHHLEELSSEYGSRLERLGAEVKLSAKRDEYVPIAQKLGSLDAVVRDSLIRFLSNRW